MNRETREGDYYCREMQTPCGIYRKLEAYENIGLEPEEVSELNAKQVPTSPIVNRYYYFCPGCGARRSIRQKHNYCHDCGQALNWRN